MTIEWLAPDRIRVDGGTQPREMMDLILADEYARDWSAGANFPPVVVFHDGTDYWLADGFHRRLAAKTLNMPVMEADVRPGTLRDALLYSFGANAIHGARRTPGDKRRTVRLMLADDAWGQESDRFISKACLVSPELVSKVRADFEAAGKPAQPIKVRRGSLTYTIPRPDRPVRGRRPEQAATAAPAPRQAPPPPPPAPDPAPPPVAAPRPPAADRIGRAEALDRIRAFQLAAAQLPDAGELEEILEPADWDLIDGPSLSAGASAAWRLAELAG